MPPPFSLDSLVAPPYPRGIDAAVQPESPSQYWLRKRAEIDLCRALVDEPPIDALGSVAAIGVEKRRLRARLVARFIERTPSLTESNFAGEAIEVAGARLDFRYQRYDLRVRRRAFVSWVYPQPLPPHFGFGLLAASGMSAIAAALIALDRQLSGERRLGASIDTYFETAQLATHYLSRLRLVADLAAAGPGDVLLLDSIARRSPAIAVAKLRLDGLLAVVCDTTCWDAASPEIALIVGRCTEAAVPLLLVRSHLKLDCLGLEYGRLGSVVVVLPRPCERSALALGRALRIRMLDFLAKSGAIASAPSLFPLSDHPEARRLNALRNLLLQRNNVRAATALAETVHARSATRILGYDHGRFLLAQPLVATDHAVGAFATDLVSALTDGNIEARRAPSFGYDLVGVTHVAGAQYQTSAAVRIALPDLPGAELDRAIAILAEWAERIDPQ